MALKLAGCGGQHGGRRRLPIIRNHQWRIYKAVDSARGAIVAVLAVGADIESMA
jgi:hypothetical protein